MAKSALALALMVLAASAGSAAAADCLQQIDDLMVQYDLPASAAFAGTQTATSQAPLPGVPKQGGLPAADLPHTPAGRSGAALLTHEGGPPQSSLPPERQLKPAQREQVQAALREARAADAVNDDAKCLDALHRAQGIARKKS